MEKDFSSAVEESSLHDNKFNAEELMDFFGLDGEQIQQLINEDASINSIQSSMGNEEEEEEDGSNSNPFSIGAIYRDSEENKSSKRSQFER